MQQLVDEWAARGRYPLNVAVNARFIGSSDALLSPAFGPGVTCYIEALSMEPTEGWTEFSAELAARWLAIPGALPHWAKEFEHVPGSSASPARSSGTVLRPSSGPWEGP